MDFKQEIITEEIPESMIDGFHSNISVKEEWNPPEENSEGFLEDYEDIPEGDYEIPVGFIEEYHENPEENPEGFLEDYEDIPGEEYNENPVGFQNKFEKIADGISWKNSETKEGMQEEDIKMCQPKTEQFQDFTDPLAVCDVKLGKDYYLDGQNTQLNFFGKITTWEGKKTPKLHALKGVFLKFYKH